MKTHKIHFINRIDNNNTGDLWCTPLLYYSKFFQQYKIVRHDVHCIRWSAIAKKDIVIVGGGGLLNNLEEWNHNINNLFDTGAIVIGWGIGHNSHYNEIRPSVLIGMSRFELIGIRDYAHSSNLSWLPCVSALHPYIQKKNSIKRRVGVVEHKDYKISDINLSKYERIDNSISIKQITDFIASSEIIITSTYHIAYWAQLMCKKVIIIGAFSSKFEYFKYKPVFYSGNIDEAINEAIIYESFCSEAIGLNNNFFEKVKQIIETNVETKASKFEKALNRIKIKIWSKESELRKILKIVKFIFPNLHRNSIKF